MPWDPKDAKRHTKKASTPKKKRQWRDVANSARARGASDASAIRQANAVVGGTAQHAGAHKPPAHKSALDAVNYGVKQGSRR